MKAEWTLSRTLMVRADGQRRWDIAYQLLMGWMNTEQVPECPHQQEEHNGNRPVRTSIDPTPATDSDD